jgi:hypothetical protein
MRVILAVDEMLAAAVKSKIPGVEVEVVDFAAMKGMGEDVDAKVRELVMSSPCVLAIGGRKWNPLKMLKAMKLPYRVPVVVLAPEGRTWTLLGTAEAMRVYSVVSSDREVGGSGIATSLAGECLAAWEWVHRRRKPGPPRMPSGSPSVLEVGAVARVVPLRPER